VLAKVDDPDLAAYVAWVPKNGAREKHVDRVTRLVTDPRASQYWDEFQAVMEPYREMYDLTGPCAGIFMLFGPDAQWGPSGPPTPDYAEDAHAKQFNRRLPQWDGRRFANKVRETLN
jgi:hypothetical protein